IIPLDRGLENSASAHFFTVPFLVARNTKVSAASRSRAATSAVSFSSSWNFTRLEMALPRVAAAASGNSYTFCQYTRPFDKNKKLKGGAEAKNKYPTKFFPLVSAQMRPLPPRDW